ncbi:protein ENHANCED DISEASE RESISTANCE 2-like [Zingiber officinale]|uniref:protein ENHANCED DISEASE RESISTANCE 2-like n=1 Tax=Zingiber officinale TaxID=94328 RepID=UPI001C4BCB07|nr:protein ENHANCED DISEASE RESISTANCE 2-like [Zingiber officinale]
MEGWLYVIRPNRLGLQKSRKRYFVLEHNALNCYKNAPTSNRENPKRTELIGSWTRVTDNGRESLKKNVFYVFSLTSISNPNNQLKLGARSSEDAARWIKSLTEAAFENPHREENVVACSKKRWQTIRKNRRNAKVHMHSIDWTVFSSMNADPVTLDVIAPSMWTIITCKNGLRLFKEAKDTDFPTKHWDDYPAIMAVGVVGAASEAIFQTVMSLGQSRSEWDFCLLEGNVVEQLDGHTDIIHKKMRGDWLPWGAKKRDLLLRRYWRREDDGTYVILYHSIVHYKCPPEKGYIRACLKSGGYEISPVNQGNQSIVKHMLAIDWKFWKPYMLTSSAIGITMKMLGRVAALREFFRASSDFSADGLTREIVLPQVEEQIKLDMQSMEENRKMKILTEESHRFPSIGSLNQMNDEDDEFFDVLTDSEYDQTEKFWHFDQSLRSPLVQDQCEDKLSRTTVFMMLHDITVQKGDYTELKEVSIEKDRMPASPLKKDSLSALPLKKDPLGIVSYGTTLTKDPTYTAACSWATADPSLFLIRGESYLQNHQKVKANGTLMQLVAADWLKSDKREDNLGARPGIVQEYAAQGGSQFFFIVHIQVPGSTLYSLALYYLTDGPLENAPLLHNFVRGDDAYRNSRFKLIPYISKGSWIVKQSVGQKACLIGQALDINYFRGSNYIELAVDVGSSTVARGVMNLVVGYLNSLVIEMAFLIQGNTQEELPESLFGTCRLNQLDVAKAVPVNPRRS